MPRQKNMHHIPIPFLFLLLFGCSDNRSANREAGQSDSDLTTSALEGHWIFVTALKVDEISFLGSPPYAQTPTRIQDPEAPITEAIFKRPNFNLIFENDTMYEVQFPISIDKRKKYSVNSGYLNCDDGHYPVEIVNDTLYLYKTLDGAYLKEGYVKRTLNDSIVGILKKHGANYPELAGTWHLIREDGGDGEGWYRLKFPHSIPDSIVMTKEDFLTTLEKGRGYMMSTSGKKRDYVYCYEWGFLRLTPASWYHGEDPWIHYVRMGN